MHDEIDASLVEIRQLAEHVQSAYVGKVEAIMSERQNASAILDQVIAYVMPAIGALEGKIETYNEKTTLLRLGNGGCISSVQTRQWHHDMKGVLLADHFTTSQGGLKGQYGGVGLYLLHDGSLLLGHRAGSWTRVVGGISEYRLDLQVTNHGEVLRLFRIEEILDGLRAVLKSQSGLATQAEAVRVRATKLATALGAVTDFLAEDIS